MKVMLYLSGKYLVTMTITTRKSNILEIASIVVRRYNATKGGLKLEENKEFTLVVWTNGNAIRKYTGQDKQEHHNSTKSGEWFKAFATIKPLHRCKT